MIVYLDSSSLLKLYLADEAGGDEVRQVLAMADTAATSSVAYTEARSAFARRRRERKLSHELFRVIRSEFDADWPHYFAVEPTAGLFNQAGELAEKYRLCALDAIDVLVTDSELSKSQREMIAAAGCELVVADDGAA